MARQFRPGRLEEIGDVDGAGDGRSSSSQSSEGWQPSQEENFQTASLGLRAVPPSDLPNAENRTQLFVGEDRAIAQTKGRAGLAVAARPMAHFMLRSIETYIALVETPAATAGNGSASSPGRR